MMTEPRDTKTSTIQIERRFDASLADLWELWTTKPGIESWWGPDGFRVDVLEIDVRPGGQLHYTMTATGAPQIEFMKSAGMPLTTRNRATYKDVVARARLVLATLVDFVPGVASYEAAVTVEFAQVAGGARVVVTLDPMHDEVWTQRMTAGWDSQLGRLAAIAGKAAHAR